MIVDPEHQRNPAVKNIRKGSGHRPHNPCPFEEQIFKCNKCGNHRYMTENKNGFCKNCHGHELGNGDKCVDQAAASQPAEDTENVTSSASSQQPAS